MKPTTHPDQVRDRLVSDIERISTITTVAKTLGIPVPTLRRHLIHDPSRLTLGELFSVAELLRRDVREYFDGDDVA